MSSKWYVMRNILNIVSWLFGNPSGKHHLLQQGSASLADIPHSVPFWRIGAIYCRWRNGGHCARLHIMGLLINHLYTAQKSSSSLPSSISSNSLIRLSLSFCSLSKPVSFSK